MRNPANTQQVIMRGWKPERIKILGPADSHSNFSVRVDEPVEKYHARLDKNGFW